MRLQCFAATLLVAGLLMSSNAQAGQFYQPNRAQPRSDFRQHILKPQLPSRDARPHDWRPGHDSWRAPERERFRQPWRGKERWRE